jgi:hypothetical protein
MKSIFVATLIALIVHASLVFIPVEVQQQTITIVVDPIPPRYTQQEILDQQQTEMGEPLLVLQCNKDVDHSVSSNIIKHKNVVANAIKNANAAKTGY